MRRVSLALLLAVCGLLPFESEAAPVPKGINKRDDAQLLEGWWEGVTMDDGRGPTPYRDKDLVRDGRLYHSGTLRNEEPGQPIRLDPTKSPKEFDVEWLPGKFYHGIYRIEGDTLTLCHGKPGQPRPTEFAGSGGATYCGVYKRATVEKRGK